MAEYTLIPKSNREQVLELNRVVKCCQAEMTLAEQEGDDIVKAMVAAGAMNTLRGLIKGVLPDIMQLVGSPLGISVEVNAKWPPEVVGDVVLSGLLQGAKIVNGEIHIASGRLYLTKVYWERRFKEFPGISAVQPPSLGLPRYQVLQERNYATVQCRLQYRLNNQVQALDRTGDNAITVVVNKGMGLDAIYGKVKKRLFQAAYAVVSGQHVEDDDDAVVAGTAAFRAGEPTTDPGVVDGEFTVMPDAAQSEAPESAGDDIAADAREALAEQTPAGGEQPAAPVPSADKIAALEAMRQKKTPKLVGAWVAHCASRVPPIDITVEADLWIRELEAAKK